MRFADVTILLQGSCHSGLSKSGNLKKLFQRVFCRLGPGLERTHPLNPSFKLHRESTKRKVFSHSLVT
jgi:hypothetical protein